MDAQHTFDLLVSAVEHGLDIDDIFMSADELCARLSTTNATVTCTSQQRLSLEGFVKQRRFDDQAGIKVRSLLSMLPR